MHGLLGYIGPETILPLASILAAIGGAFLVAGRSIVKLAKGCLAAVIPGSKHQEASQSEDAA
jgi:hypothetical protein